MKKLKQNLLKTVVGVACVVLPANRLYGQTINNYELDTDNVVGGCVSYVIPAENNNYGIGLYGNWGIATRLNMPDTKINTGATLMLNAGAMRFNTDANKYRGQIGATFKLNAGYGPVSLEYIKEMGVAIGDKNGTRVIDAHGAGIGVRVGEYLKIYTDFLYATPIFQQGHTAPDDKNQKYALRAGILYTVSRKTR